MEKLFNWLSLLCAAVGGFFSSIFGGLDGLFIALIVLVVADYITGVIKAIMTKTLSSAVGFKGIFKKVLIFIVVAVAYLVQANLNLPIAIRDIVIFFYLANEGISFCENIAEFIPLPKKLKDIFIQLRDKSESDSDGI